MKETFKITGIKLPVKVKTVADSLFAICRENGNELKTKDIVNAARPKASALHDIFEWKDSIAGEKYRLEQARQLIKHVVVIKEIKGEKKEIRAFVNVRTDEKGNLSTNPFATGDSKFIYVDRAMGDDVLRKYTLERALRELTNLMDKYNDLNELSHIFELVKKGLKKIKPK